MSAFGYIALGFGVFLGNYLYTLNRAKNEITVEVNARKNRLTTQGVELKLGYNIKNPTRALIKLQPPLIKLFVDGRLLSSSNMEEVEIPVHIKDERGQIQIRAFTETGIITSKIVVPWITLLSISARLLNRLQSGEGSPIKIQVETVSEVNTGGIRTPLKDTTIVSL